MFTSHLLTVQIFVQRVLNDENLKYLITLAKEEGVKDGPSATIAKYLQSVREEHPLLPASPPSRAKSESQRPRLREDKSILRRFQDHLISLQEQEDWVEQVQTYSCAFCGCNPLKSFITSCLHRYCEECFDLLPDQNQERENAERICQTCQVQIRSAVFCVDVIDSDTSSSDDHIEPPSRKKRKINDAEQRDLGSANAKKKRHPRKQNPSTVSEFLATQTSLQPTTRTSETRTEHEPNASFGSGLETESQIDLIKRFGSLIPGAKLDAVRDLIQKWITEDQTVKIVLFVEFMDTIRILEDMCDKSKWKCVVVCRRVNVVKFDI